MSLDSSLSVFFVWHRRSRMFRASSRSPGWLRLQSSVQLTQVEKDSLSMNITDYGQMQLNMRSSYYSWFFSRFLSVVHNVRLILSLIHSPSMKIHTAWLIPTIKHTHLNVSKSVHQFRYQFRCGRFLIVLIQDLITYFIP